MIWLLVPVVFGAGFVVGRWAGHVTRRRLAETLEYVGEWNEARKQADHNDDIRFIRRRR